MMRRLVRAVLLILLLSCARLAAAQIVVGGCTLADTAMAFGTYTGGGASQTSSSSGTVTCDSSSDTWSISLDAGHGAGGTETTRYMTGPGGAKLAYGVFQNSGDTTYWGNTTATEVSGSGTTTVTFWGQITAGQYPTPGTYTDTLDTGTTSFNVSVTVVAACSISATNLNFGTYTGVRKTSTSTISVTCTNTTTYNVGLNAGTATGATVTTRKMTDPGGYTLSYGLYQNTGHSTNWGNTVGTDTKAGTGTGALQPLTVYGQLPAATVPPVGNYIDTITATITY